ncbi:MAG: Hsp70 family protein [Acidobacteriota bacterium]
MTLNSTIVGIDLGTTNSLIAVVESEGPRILPNAVGDDLTPSAVLVDQGNVSVGKIARARASRCPEKVAMSFKRDMGTSRTFELEGKVFSPQELSAAVLRNLKQDAESSLGCSIEEAVISVPAYFNEAQRNATREAGEIAGLKVERLLNEPTAAAIAYGMHRREEELKVVVLDLGGGTFDVTVLEILEGVIEIQATAGDSRLGGDDFTSALAKALWSRQGLTEQDLPASPISRARWWAACDQAKARLSSQGSARIALPEFEIQPGSFQDFEIDLERNQVDEIWEPLVARLKGPTLRALRDADLRPESISDVLLVGGSTRLPCVQRFAASLFQRMPSRHPEPERIVAKGAALQAGLKDRNAAVEDLVVTDVAPFSLGIATRTTLDGFHLDDSFSPILERGTVIPASRIEQYTTVSDNQEGIQVEVFQGEHSLCQDNTALGKLKVSVPKAPAGKEMIDVRFTYDLNALLEVEVTVHSTQETHHLLLTGSKTRMSAEEIENARRAMKALKFHPRDALPNATALARAEDLYIDLRGRDREHLALAMAAFRAALDSQDPEQITAGRDQLNAVVDRLR